MAYAASKQAGVEPPTAPKEIHKIWTAAHSNGALITGTKMNWMSLAKDKAVARADGGFHYDIDSDTKKLRTMIYFEVQIMKLSPGAVVSIGFCENKVTAQKFLPGTIQNTIGYLNSGAISKNKPNNTFKFSKGYGQGDIVGLGVGFDSFNQFLAFATLNGEFLGYLSDLGTIPHGMHLYPCVGTENSTALTLNFNFSGPFKAAQAIPERITAIDPTSYMASLPKELVEHIVVYAAHSKTISALTLTRVCKLWKDKADSNDVWKHLYINFYPNQNKKLNIKNWKQFFRRRALAVKARNLEIDKSRSWGASTEIENCTMEFECPLIWEKLPPASKTRQPHPDDETQRHCDRCNQTVYFVDNLVALAQHAELGHCVAYSNRPKAPLMMGSVAYHPIAVPNLPGPPGPPPPPAPAPPPPPIIAVAVGGPKYPSVVMHPTTVAPPPPPPQ